MSEKQTRYLLWAILVTGILSGLYAMVVFMDVNRVRADEFLSFLHSNPTSHPSWIKVWQHIGEGSDNSYVHAVLLHQVFSWFGATLLNQRLLSLAGWVAGGALLWSLLKEQPRSVQHRAFFWWLIQFSNMGFMLADDGRFYSLHYALFLLLVWLVVRFMRSRKKIWLFGCSLAALVALLTTSLSVLGIGVLVGALGLLWLRKDVPLQVFLFVAMMQALACIVYFSVFRIAPFQQHFISWLFSPVANGTLPLRELVSTPFRFIGIAWLPGLPDAAGVIFTLAGVVVWIWYSRRQTASASGSVQFFMQMLALVFVSFYVLQAIAVVSLGWPVWPFRYYAGLFWLVPYMVYQSTTDNLSSPVLRVVVLLLGFTFALRMWNEIQKIPVRKAAQAPVANGKVAFVETSGTYNTLGKMGDMYLRFPASRPLLFLCTDSLSVERNAYFARLQQQGDHLQTISPEAIDSSFTVVLGDEREAASWKQKGFRVVVLPQEP